MLSPLMERYVLEKRTTQGIANKIPFLQKIRDELALNQSVDTLIYGTRGDGKSSVGIALGYLIDKNFSTRNIVFTMDDFLKLAHTLPKGSVIVFDETGTQSSGMSSRNFMSEGNKDTVDVWQMVRTKQICTICITLDANRIDNRIRETFRYHIVPMMKLDNTATKGHGLAVVCDVREIVKAKTEEGSDTLFSLKTSKPDGVAWLSIPLPPADLIEEYEAKRNYLLNKMIVEALAKREAKKNPPPKQKRGRKPYSSGSSAKQNASLGA